MTNQHVYIIAEAGVNHNGRLDLALQLCDAAKAAGVDAVKFQTWKTELIITKGTKKAEYQEKNLNNDDTESLDFLVNLGMPFIKLGSGDITNIPYLRSVAKYGMPVILSTGMANLAQVAIAYDTLQEAGVKDISILHCTTNYPCPMNEVNLRAMQTMKEAFKCRVGYSDHTMGIEVPIAAVAMGAEIIEKHFTLDQNMEGPDHRASLNPEELKAMVSAIRHIEQALGDGIKQPNESEKKISKVVLKRIVASRPIKKGEILSEDNMTVKRSDNGIKASYWDVVAGRVAQQDYSIDEEIKL